MTEAELLILRLDGVVIDTYHSIYSTVRRTVQFYLTSFLGVRGSGPFLSDVEVRQFRLTAGLDNPWDLSAALLRYILTAFPDARYEGTPPRHSGEAVAVLKRRMRSLKTPSWDTLREQLDFEEAARRIHEAGGGVDGVREAFGGWEHPLLFAEGEIKEGNLLRHLFQEIYLGRATFGSVERMPARFYRGSGMYENERLLLGRSMLERLRGQYRPRMAVVTEWVRAMAELSLNHLESGSLFDVLLTAEDVQGEEARLGRLGRPESLRKPHPFILLEAAAHLDPDGVRPALYVGNSPDDMRAARAAGQAGKRPFEGWAFLAESQQMAGVEEQLRAAGAERVIVGTEQLVEALL